MEEVKQRGGARPGSGRQRRDKQSIVFQVRCTDDERLHIIRTLNLYRLANRLPVYKPRCNDEEEDD